ncbi:hypothetical protein HK096_004045 [Nowakowskiella sp. JEL0078]|nr:hypothetical protein HK096_004045 [Nowakowskiella sp. JEL0078]
MADGKIKIDTDQEVQLQFKCGGYTKVILFHVAELANDVILGIPWFDSIHVHDLMWLDLCFGFHTQNSHGAEVFSVAINLVEEDPFNNISHCISTDKDIEELLYNIGFVNLTTTILLPQHSNTMTLDETNLLTCAPDVAAVLHEYPIVFAESKELPPSCLEDYKIQLINENRPPKI